MAREHLAGAVAYARREDTCVFLLVTSRRRRKAWVFPKGHIEQGETAEACAMRELTEEAGVTGVAIGSLGSVAQKRDGRKTKVEYVLVRQRRQGEPQEGRQRVWLPYEEARDTLAYKSARKILDRAAERLGLV